MKSIIGSILDPMADKLLMTICTVSLSYISSMPLYLPCLIIGRDVLLSFMAIYYRYVTLPPPKTFKRLINISIPTVSVHPNFIIQSEYRITNALYWKLGIATCNRINNGRKLD